MELTVTATEFKAKCLELFDRLSSRNLDRVTVTKRGKPVAVVEAPRTPVQLDSPIGALRGRVIAPPDFDWFAPVLDGPTDAELGILHN
mgnify:FL=1